MNCSVCRKSLPNYLQDDAGRVFCSEACFETTFPKCASCGKPMRQWTESSDSGRKYCSESCFQSEFPTCASCGKRMKQWTVSQDSGKKYCSAACFESESPTCAACGKKMQSWTVSNETGKKYCDESCFATEWPSCESCGKRMNEWIISQDSSKKYCSEECFSEEFPECAVCGERMQHWHETDVGSRYCSEDCMSTLFPRCETCLAPMTKWIEDDQGHQFCSDRCKETDTKCREIAKRNRPKNWTAAEGIGVAAGVMGAAANYADHVILQTGWKDPVTGQRITTGHGVAAEKASHMADRLSLRDAQHVGVNNQKHGPDRIVDGQEIQTKYFKTPNGSVGACFDSAGDGNFKYYDSSGRPMQIEVPKDQYSKAISLMEEKIRAGKVPGVTDPADAKKIIREGWFTHAQAKNICRFGTVESLTYDAVNGIRVAGVSFGISAVISFAVAIWQGKDAKEAGKIAAIAGLKVGGISFVTTVAVAQVGRTGLEQSLRVASEAAVRKLGPNVCAALAKGLSGKSLSGAAAYSHVAKLLRGNVVTGVVVTVVLSTKDIYHLLSGKVSFKQAIKNVATTGASVAGGIGGGLVGAAKGAAAGAAIGSAIPIVGTAVGGTVGGIIGLLGGGVVGGAVAGKAANAAMGLIIEDDAVALGEKFGEYTAELSENFMLSEQEVSTLGSRIGAMDLSSTLREMYADSNKRSFVAAQVKPELVAIVSSRKVVQAPTPDVLSESLEVVLEELEAKS